MQLRIREDNICICGSGTHVPCPIVTTGVTSCTVALTGGGAGKSREGADHEFSMIQPRQVEQRFMSEESSEAAASPTRPDVRDNFREGSFS
jgi:hypothetical protein